MNIYLYEQPCGTFVRTAICEEKKDKKMAKSVTPSYLQKIETLEFFLLTCSGEVNW